MKEETFEKYKGVAKTILVIIIVILLYISGMEPV